MPYPSTPAGQRITGALLESMLPLVAYKATTEAVTSSTTLQDDDDLAVAVEANATYDVTLHLLHDSATAGDLEIGWSGPTSATMQWGMIGAQNTTTSSTTVPDLTMPSRAITETNEIGGGASTGTYCLVHGVLITSSTAGTLQFRWAQGTSNATASNVRAGSILTLRRIA